MANFDRSGMTQAGINLMGKAVGGATIQLTRLVLGDGTMTGEILDLQGVVSPKQNVDVTRIERNDNQCTVGGELLTSSVKQGFFWRECGLYAMDPEQGEILYNYAYSTKPDYIAAADSGIMEEILVSMVATVGSNTNVDVTIDTSMVMTTKKEFIPLKNKVDDLCISVKDYGVLGDGTDETLKIQKVLDLGGHIVFPQGTYLFEQLMITQDNTTVEFLDGVILQSRYRGDQLDLGAIEIKGTKGSSFNLASDAFEGKNNITLSSVDGINVGDFLKLEQNNPSTITFESFKTAYCNSIVTVKEINGNTITINEVLPHNYFVSSMAKATVFIPIKNTTIIGKNTLFDKLGTTEYANHFYVDLAYNLKIKGFECVNGGGKGVTVWESHTFTIKDIIHKNPTNVSAGHGYCIQICDGSCYGRIENVNAINSRHGVDFATGANNCIVDKFFGHNAEVSGHGQNTKHIKVINSTASGSAFGNGNYTFLCDSNWEFNNCTVINSDRGFNIAAQGYDTKIINCKIENCNYGITLSGATNIDIANLKMKQCRIGFEFQQNTNDVKVSYVTATSIPDDNNTSTSLSYIIIKDTCHNIAFDNLNLNVATYKVIEISGTEPNDKQVKIQNCTRIESCHSSVNRQSLKFITGGVSIINCILCSDVLLTGDSKYIFINNSIDNIKVDIRSTKNTMVSGNMGNAIQFSTPTHNDADVIVVNNIKVSII